MDITSEHPQYVSSQLLHAQYWDLYVGGEHLKQRAHLYLERRQKEPVDIYSERLGRVFYENYIGSIVDWYTASLFRRNPRIAITAGNPVDDTFYADFVDNCDRRGTGFATHLQNAF